MMPNLVDHPISQWRKERGISQEALAKALDVSVDTVIQWESDRPFDEIMRIPEMAEALGISAEQLIRGISSQVRCVLSAERKELEDLVLSVDLSTAKGDNVHARIPMNLIRIAVESGIDMSTCGVAVVRDLDMARIIELARCGIVGQIIHKKNVDGKTLKAVIE